MRSLIVLLVLGLVACSKPEPAPASPAAGRDAKGFPSPDRPVAEIVAPRLAITGAGVAVIVSALVLWRHLRPEPTVAAGAS